jgi:hypothetical protein
MFSRVFAGWGSGTLQTGPNVAIFRAAPAAHAALTSVGAPLICPSTWRPEPFPALSQVSARKFTNVAGIVGGKVKTGAGSSI